MRATAPACEATGSQPAQRVPRLVSQPVRMDLKSVEDRLKVLEERTDEWHATLRVRIVGATALSERCEELAKGTHECWKLKVETAELLLIDLEPLMPVLFPDVQQRNECLAHQEYVYGVFPIAGKWGSEKSLDLRMKAGLYGLRLHALVKTVLGPKLKQQGGQFQMWIPLSQTEMGKRDRKRKEREDREGPAIRRGRYDDPWFDGVEQKKSAGDLVLCLTCSVPNFGYEYYVQFHLWNHFTLHIKEG